jgi:hypothetical protein
MIKEMLTLDEIEWELLGAMQRSGFLTARSVEVYLLSGALTMNSANWDVARFDVGNEDAEAFVWTLVDVARSLQRQCNAAVESRP